MESKLLISEHVATFFDLPTDVMDILNAHDTKVTNVKDLSSTDYADISILVGWENAEIANAILNAPNSRLHWIQTHSAGVDYLPKDIIATRNITVTNASGVHAEPIAQAVIGDILYFSRSFFKHAENTANKIWSDDVENYVISEMTYLIFGTGNIGIELAKNLKALHANVIGINHSGRAVEGFDKTYPIAEYAEALKDADVVINILPGTEETRHFFNHDFFSHVDNKFLFINVGRGFSVDNQALVDAVATNKFRYIALDVVDPEPLPADSILWNIPNVLITGHSTGYFADYNLRLARIFKDNLPSFFTNGTFIRNVVNLCALRTFE